MGFCFCYNHSIVASLQDAVTPPRPRPTLRSFVAYVGLLALRASCPSGTSGVAALVPRALPLATELLPLTGLLKEYVLIYLGSPATANY